MRYPILLLFLVAGCAEPPARHHRPPSAPGTAAHAPAKPDAILIGIPPEQVPDWTADDLEFFLRASMCDEVLPERLIEAFRGTYPEMFPGGDLTAFGLVPASDGAGKPRPYGVSIRSLPHLGGLRALGINCASCHLSEIRFPGIEKPLRVLGTAGQFDVQALFGAVVAGTYRAASTADVFRFLSHYLRACDPGAGTDGQALLTEILRKQGGAVAAILREDPLAAKGVAPGAHHRIAEGECDLTAARLREGMDLAALTRSLLKLFRNVRTALRISDPPPAPPAVLAGPGRNDAFGVLAGGLLGIKTSDAPAKFGVIWNMDRRVWNHWDANSGSPLTRNIAAVIGLGSAVVDGKAYMIDPPPLIRHQSLAERIRPPKYPGPVDAAAAERGAKHYTAACASCHDGPEDDHRLYGLDEIGTDPVRARQFTAEQVARYETWPDGAYEIPGYAPPGRGRPTFRVTGKYWSSSLDGVWARSPYLHNGSVRTMRELLTPPGERPKSFRRGSRNYDPETLGFTDEGYFQFDTTLPGNGNGGHDYGTRLSDGEKADLMEYLKSR